MRLTAMLALLGLLFVTPTWADAPASGTFTANAACPAVQSIKKGTNPGTIMLTPQQGSEGVSANKTPPTHYLLIVPGANPERRWAEVGCGTLSGAAPKSGSTTPVTPTPGTTTTPASDEHMHPTVTTHDTYVLAISWEPDFCAPPKFAGKPECKAETSTSFDASHFTLHGLWRDPWPKPYSNCQADGQTYMDASNDNKRWGEIPVTLSAATKAHLDEDMPGTLSHLEGHEWIAHGTCSGVTADAFFARATALLDAVNASSVRTFFTGKIGQRLSIEDLRAAVEQAFGPGTGKNVIMDCASGLVTEVHFGLTGDVMGSGALPAMLAAGYVPGDNRPCRAGNIQAAK